MQNAQGKLDGGHENSLHNLQSFRVNQNYAKITSLILRFGISSKFCTIYFQNSPPVTPAFLRTHVLAPPSSLTPLHHLIDPEALGSRAPLCCEASLSSGLSPAPSTAPRVPSEPYLLVFVHKYLVLPY